MYSSIFFCFLLFPTLGAGLYHFGVRLVDEEVSFCDLSTEFIAFVDNEPLPDHLMQILNASVVSGFCGVMFIVFLYHFYYEADSERYDEWD